MLKLREERDEEDDDLGEKALVKLFEEEYHGSGSGANDPMEELEEPLPILLIRLVLLLVLSEYREVLDSYPLALRLVLPNGSLYLEDGEYQFPESSWVLVCVDRT